MGGAVYFSWPQSEGGQSWQLLGTISNSKPSAIFRVAKLKGSSQDDNKENITNSFMELGHPPRLNAMVGISVEPLVVIEGQTPAAQTEASNVSSFMEFGQIWWRICLTTPQVLPSLPKIHRTEMGKHLYR